MTTPRIARGCVLAMALLFPALTLGATVPYDFACDPGAAIRSDPNQHKRVGYITAFKGLGLAPASLKADIKVTTPYSGLTAAPGKPPSPGSISQVIGVIEKLEWDGGAGSPIRIDFYVSRENAVLIKTLQQQTLKSTKIDQLGWWIADYDQEKRKWYEQAYALGASNGTISGMLAGKNNPELNVDVTPVRLSSATLYKVSLSVAPPANSQQSLYFASSPSMPVRKAWGLQVGTATKSGL